MKEYILNLNETKFFGIFPFPQLLIVSLSKQLKFNRYDLNLYMIGC